MLARLNTLYKQYGTISHSLITADGEMVSPGRYTRRFYSLNMAYQAMFGDIIAKRKAEVAEQVRNLGHKVDPRDDFIVKFNPRFHV